MDDSKRLELAHEIVDWFKDNGYADEIDDNETTRIYDWLLATDTSGMDTQTMALEYELQMF